ncbi:hypothetical protein SAMN05216571_11090 [Onishia taeanensis]|uniref:Uncharacterized protein n=2 Tax=Onishia taeanensis TaxID=284577 RepID=A0A1G7TIA3_9GAMM|nr:hypothetical protein SAMN05216571_11090 [Halomonas taeanensis]
MQQRVNTHRNKTYEQILKEEMLSYHKGLATLTAYRLRNTPHATVTICRRGVADSAQVRRREVPKSVTRSATGWDGDEEGVKHTLAVVQKIVSSDTAFDTIPASRFLLL